MRLKERGRFLPCLFSPSSFCFSLRFALARWLLEKIKKRSSPFPSPPRLLRFNPASRRTERILMRPPTARPGPKTGHEGEKKRGRRKRSLKEGDDKDSFSPSFALVSSPFSDLKLTSSAPGARSGGVVMPAVWLGVGLTGVKRRGMRKRRLKERGERKKKTESSRNDASAAAGGVRSRFFSFLLLHTYFFLPPLSPATRLGGL